MNPRQGWHTEESRDESYREILADEKSLGEAQQKVLWQVIYGPKTLQEISEIIGMKEHLVCARLNELRKNEWIYTDQEKKLNPITGKKNSLWKLNPRKFEHQLNIF